MALVRRFRDAVTGERKAEREQREILEHIERFEREHAVMLERLRRSADRLAGDDDTNDDTKKEA